MVADLSRPPISWGTPPSGDPPRRQPLLKAGGLLLERQPDPAWVIALAKWAKVMLSLVIPLFLGAALIEVFITPQIAVYLLGS